MRSILRDRDPTRPLVLTNACLPNSVIGEALSGDRSSLVSKVIIEVVQGQFHRIEKDNTPTTSEDEAKDFVDLEGRMILPRLVDCHTHLDKGHILPRTPMANGTFGTALSTVKADREASWNADDVRQRMEFGLKSAFHHGTGAIRTHLDSHPGQLEISWPVLEALRNEWAGRIDLQAAALIPIEMVGNTEHFDRLCSVVAKADGALGAVAYPCDSLVSHVEQLFVAAKDRGLRLDFHADETLDPGARALEVIADATLRHGYGDRVLVGHCCSLAQLSPPDAARIIGKCAEGGLSVVSLPMCNLYLQDRQDPARTPRLRGVTALKELAHAGVNTAVASDNTRDPFFAYGDLDMLETFREATRILQLDHPHGDWISAATHRAARAMGLAGHGRLDVGGSADCIIFEGRAWHEVLSRPESNRIVLKAGRPNETTLPDYRELDPLVK
ncbi:cytosine deaminase [Cucumibacter marinus]|uniref:cytosine deaminase n=1 Tax=Cucumibacter marinus TaxID=1121252 RepID=UPI000491E66E|nr:cytosine deaminase [Cucumibacter marinus]